MNLKKLGVIISFMSSVLMFAQEEKKDNEYFIKFGRAVRYNIFSKSWVNSSTHPEATIDTWRLNVTARKKGG